MRHKVYFPSFIILLILLSTLFSCKKENHSDIISKIDSLNKVSYSLHYKDLYASSKAASEAYKLAANHPSLRAEALNNLGFTAFMRMDFEKAERLFKQVYNESNNELEALVADINMMKICQRTAMNKEFYDYRNSALHRFKRINDDISSLTTKHEFDRLNYARSEFSITSSIYYYYLQQDDMALKSINEINMDETLIGDTAQLLYYYYMKGSGGLYQAPTYEDMVIGEFNYLLECLRISNEKGYIYFEANASQGIAELLKNKKNYDIIMERRPGLIRMINPENLEWKDLTLRFAEGAIKQFKKYGDWYQISGSYRTLAGLYNELQENEKGLEYLTTALDYVNKHHQRYYNCKDSADLLRPYIPMDTLSIELNWINNKNIKTVPEWIARLREQLSVTYSAMGMKPQSDYNRNIYLDILDYTRQDKELESRYKTLERESELLTGMLGVVITGIVIIIVLFWLLNKRWRKKNALYIEKLKKTIDISRKITASVTSKTTDIEEVTESIMQSVGNEICTLTGCSEFAIVIVDEEGNYTQKNALLKLPIIASDKKQIIGYVFLDSLRKIKKEDKVLINIILPYISWTLENGITFISLGEERMQFEKEQYVHQQHITENKRQNLVKKACLFIITGIMPYIDRIINEVNKLNINDNSLSREIKKEKLQYIDELVTRINDYNEIIALWIKMRQGALALNIENFKLNELFEVVAKGRKTFEMKQQLFSITNNDYIVKADKALTLFMINTLTENARKYTGKGGNVSLYAEDGGDYIEVSIKDNGPGISQEDINRILGEKIYDSGTIGIKENGHNEEFMKNKGNGFGLMNCKGIIEKYRKTNTLFRVCKFDIESNPGKGSRFYFRLPKGIIRIMMIALIFIPVTLGCSHGHDSVRKSNNTSDSINRYDSLLAIANDFSYKVYNSNVTGYYQDAITYADSAMKYLNLHYSKYESKKGPFLKVTGENTPTELKWLDKGFDTDYYTILDLRNESAVAFLALGEIENYNFNNNAYTALYKQISKDASLEQYCKKMQFSSNNKIVAIILCIVLFFILLIGYYILYSRHLLLYRFNLEQVLEINKKIFTSSFLHMHGSSEITRKLVNVMFDGMNELMPINLLGIGVYNEETKNMTYGFSPSDSKHDRMHDIMHKSFDSKKPIEEDKIKSLPLWIEISGEKHCVGVMAIEYNLNHNEDENLMLEIISGYVAIVVYNAVVIMEQKQRDIETAQDESRRAMHEENMLHVQNLVLDNCLSTIKHETVYYPNKIKQIVGKINIENPSDDTGMQFHTMQELVNYYKDVFSILTSCAARQLDEITFRRSKIATKDIADHAIKYFRYISKKTSLNVDLQVNCENLYITGDIIQLKFMIENLINNALYNTSDGNLKMKVYAEGDFVRFDFIDKRENKSQEELNLMFYPENSGMNCDENGKLKGSELLICKQIIRDHDEYTGRRGCRINATVLEDGGYDIWFTIPKK